MFRKMEAGAIGMYLRGRQRLLETAQRFMTEEKGANTLVEIVVVIIIVLAIAAIFKDQLTQFVQNAMEKLLEFGS